MQHLELPSLATLFGDESPSSLIYQEKFASAVRDYDLSFRYLTESEQSLQTISLLRTLDDSTIDRSGPSKFAGWESGWSDNLNAFVQNNYNPVSLVPGYYRPSFLSRYSGTYVANTSPTFQFDVFCLLRRYLCLQYLGNIDNIIEFGCGPGHNIYSLSQLFPNATLRGFDWAPASAKILKLMASKLGVNCSGGTFDFFKPDHTLDVSNSGVLTFGGLEQTGSNFKAFVDYLIDKKPSICINVEPLDDLYNPDVNLSDYLAYRYHCKRGYLDRFLSHLLLLQHKSKIQILKIHKVSFGGAFHDGWSYVIWRPL